MQHQSRSYGLRFWRTCVELARVIGERADPKHTTSGRDELCQPHIPVDMPLHGQSLRHNDAIVCIHATNSQDSAKHPPGHQIRRHRMWRDTNLDDYFSMLPYTPQLDNLRDR